MDLYPILRPLLFRLDAELAHHATVELCRLGGYWPGLPTFWKRLLTKHVPTLASIVAGVPFANPIGLAAGWDKSGRALRLLDHLGFGHVEIGSVSARPAVGNPRPRLFRLPAESALIVNYGLPNDGAVCVARRLARYRPQVPIGVNIVKTNEGPTAPPATAAAILADYYTSVARLHPHADFLTLNLSCPNVTGGKDFFAMPGHLRQLLTVLHTLPIRCPIFLKLVPNPAPAEQDRILEEVDPFPFVRGFLYNLPTGKPASLKFQQPVPNLTELPGAVSGKPVAELLDHCLSGMYRRMDRRRYSLIGSGGVWTAADAFRKIQLGASLVQIYTSLVYQGPALIPRLNLGLRDLLRQHGFASISQAVGSAY